MSPVLVEFTVYWEREVGTSHHKNGADGNEPACQRRGWRRHGSIPGSGRGPGGGRGNPLSVPAWRVPWTEEPGGLQPTRWQSCTRLRD